MKALENLAAVRKLTVKTYHVPGSCGPEQENQWASCKDSLVEYCRKLSPKDQIHFEICRNDNFRWKLLQEFIKDRLIVAQLNATIHDPPEIIGQIAAPLSENKMLPGEWWRPYFRKIWRKSPFAYSIIRRSLRAIDRIYLLTQSGAYTLRPSFDLSFPALVRLPHVQFTTISWQGRNFKSFWSPPPVIFFRGAFVRRTRLEVPFR